MKTCRICGKEIGGLVRPNSHVVECEKSETRKKNLKSELREGKRLCELGCGRIARFVLKLGKVCCEKYAQSCPEMRRKNSETKKGRCPPWKNGHPRYWLGKKGWSSGKTYEKLFGDKRAGEIKERIRQAALLRTITGLGSTPAKEGERREKIRQKINARYDAGWMPKAGRCKKIHYTSSVCGNVVLDGSWEFEFARFLDRSGYEWERNKKRFSYFFDGKWRCYTPDFYIKLFDVFVEMKGYITDKDRAKWNQFPRDLKLVPVGKSVVRRIREGTYRIEEIKEGCDNWQSACLLNK